MHKDGYNSVGSFEDDSYTGMSKDSSKFFTEVRNIGNRDEDIFFLLLGQHHPWWKRYEDDVTSIVKREHTPFHHKSFNSCLSACQELKEFQRLGQKTLIRLKAYLMQSN